MDGLGEGRDSLLYTFQLVGVMLVDDGCELRHAVPETVVPCLLVLWRQLDPGLHVDGESFRCGVVVDVFAEDGGLAGVVGFCALEFNQLVERGGGGIDGCCGGIGWKCGGGDWGDGLGYWVGLHRVW